MTRRMAASSQSRVPNVYNATDPGKSDTSTQILTLILDVLVARSSGGSIAKDLRCWSPTVRSF